MVDLWYDFDEVTQFHPIVEKALKQSLVKNGLSDILEVAHHPTIGTSSIVPDFGIRLINSQRYIFIIEVKRTQRDVDSQRFANQTRSYVQDFVNYWDPNYYPYFCITNIEKLVLYANRDGPINSCILKNNPYSFGIFDISTHNADIVIENFELGIENIIDNIFNRTKPEWDNNWTSIIENFSVNYKDLRSCLKYDEETSKNVSLYELFRLYGYLFLKEYYRLNKADKSQYFNSKPINNRNLQHYKNRLENIFHKILTLDFQQIFSDYPDPEKRIFPENFNSETLSIFSDLLDKSAIYFSEAIKENQSPSYFFNLLTAEVYSRDELHLKGKVMTDAELSSLLATICINDPEAIVLDPSCGDGALLDAAYDQINLACLFQKRPKTHNELLSQLNGIEIDPFLAQLATFRLLSKNLNDVGDSTRAKIEVANIFERPKPNSFDVVLMNPPFLRNDDSRSPIQAKQKAEMIQAIKGQEVSCFVEQASQPNLYFYFVNYIWHYLKEGGKAGIILMAKFLNNKDGIHLKDFIKDKVESVIIYPKNYFSEFKVTTLIVVLKNGASSDQVSFLRVIDSSLLEEPQKIKSILTQNHDSYNDVYTLKKVNRDSLCPLRNWRLYFLDPEGKFERLLDLDIFKSIEYFFGRIKRGSAGNSGGSDTIFLKNSTITEYSIEKQFVGIGIKSNKVKRKYILTQPCLNIEPALHVQPFCDVSTNGLSSQLSIFNGINNYYDAALSKFGSHKWKKIVNESFRSKVTPQILIPRAERTKHTVYYNPFNVEIVVSTNFMCLYDFSNYKKGISTEVQLKFVTAFLLSSFGQIQLELTANDQEGMRKLEEDHIKKIKLIDIEVLSLPQILEVVSEFEKLNQFKAEFSGNEGKNTPRRNLDIKIGEIIFDFNNLGFSSVEKLVDNYELALFELLEARRT